MGLELTAYQRWIAFVVWMQSRSSVILITAYGILLGPSQLQICGINGLHVRRFGVSRGNSLGNFIRYLSTSRPGLPW